jgi:hypothetical protein
MTTLIAWVAYDQRRPSSFYLASDSRITWGSQHHRWDAGRKLFACRNSPDLFGYAGDVVFPCLCLSQVVDALDNGLLVTEEASPSERADAVYNAIQTSFGRRHNVIERDFTIFHATRENEGVNTNFHFWSIEFISESKTWSRTEVLIGDRTNIVKSAGSGGKSAEQHAALWTSYLDPGLSRSIFSGFCDHLEKKEDPLSGGAPQLVGLYLKGPAKNFGIVSGGQPFLYGLPVVPNMSSASLEWRDTLLQRVDGQTLKLVSGSQRHARPTQLAQTGH